jgi:hypothetical protein
MSTGSILAMAAVERRKRSVRSRTVTLRFVLIVALAQLETNAPVLREK